MHLVSRITLIETVSFFFLFLILTSVKNSSAKIHKWICMSFNLYIECEIWYITVSEMGFVTHSLWSLAFLWQLLNSGKILEQQKSFRCCWNPGFPAVSNHSSFADDIDPLPGKDKAHWFWEMFRLFFSTEPLSHAVPLPAWLILSLG